MFLPRTSDSANHCTRHMDICSKLGKVRPLHTIPNDANQALQ